MSMLAGIGFTVSLLISELAFTDDPTLTEQAKAAVLVGSVMAAIAASIVLRIRNNAYARLCAEENRDDDGDGIPDIYQGTPIDCATGSRVLLTAPFPFRNTRTTRPSGYVSPQQGMIGVGLSNPHEE